MRARVPDISCLGCVFKGSLRRKHAFGDIVGGSLPCVKKIFYFYSLFFILCNCFLSSFSFCSFVCAGSEMWCSGVANVTGSRDILLALMRSALPRGRGDSVAIISGIRRHVSRVGDPRALGKRSFLRAVGKSGPRDSKLDGLAESLTSGWFRAAGRGQCTCCLFPVRWREGEGPAIFRRYHHVGFFWGQL